MTGSEAGDFQSKRDRVRALLIQPLERLGFRFPKTVSEGDAKAKLDSICDDLAYMGGLELRALAECLRTKGEGSARKFWPDRATILAEAERFQRRDLEELPAMASWFGSVKGPEAVEAGVLVPTFLFITEFKRPPVRGNQDFAKVRVRGTWWSDIARDVRMAQSRLRRGVPLTSDEQAMLAWYDDIEARAKKLVAAGEEKRRAVA